MKPKPQIADFSWPLRLIFRYCIFSVSQRRFWSTMISKISAHLDHSKGARENSVNLSFGNPLGSHFCLVIYLWGSLAHCCSVLDLNRSDARVELETLTSRYVLECWRSFLVKLLLVQKRFCFCQPNWFRDFCFYWEYLSLAVALRKPRWNIRVVFG